MKNHHPDFISDAEIETATSNRNTIPAQHKKNQTTNDEIRIKKDFKEVHDFLLSGT